MPGIARLSTEIIEAIAPATGWPRAVHDLAGKRFLFAAEAKFRRRYRPESARLASDRPVRINDEGFVFEVIRAVDVPRRGEIGKLELALRIGGGFADLDDGERATRDLEQQHADACCGRIVGGVDAVAVDYVAMELVGGARVAVGMSFGVSAFAGGGCSSAAEMGRLASVRLAAIKQPANARNRHAFTSGELARGGCHNTALRVDETNTQRQHTH